ncbi:ribonuclease H family protein [Candidatus Merdisoma sp. JLR.KK006]|uniref:ribonuclease H family protein n=1 Tax=Candidatus Merdisoma sp. JLR.KK006 TaxID=3112626 RepID=UPI002FF01E8D
MVKKKVYAVKKGKTTGLFYSWNECEDVTSGYPGAEFKGFGTETEARAYLEGKAEEEEIPMEELLAEEAAIEKLSIEEIQSHKEKLAENQVIAYVDGSFDKSMEKYSFGCIFLIPGGRIIKEFGNGNEPESLAIRNVAGEMLGAMYAAQWAVVNGYEFIELRYDYEGIEKWATSVWKANNVLTQKYAAFMQKKRRQIHISFQKVKAHSGDYYNEQVDRLAKAALTEGNGIPKVQKLEEKEM